MTEPTTPTGIEALVVQDIAGALLAKIQYNAGCPPMHGKEF
jgi:hypothetical protein